VRVEAEHTCAAAPAAVWRCLADPALHERTLPAAVRDRQVHETGEISGTVEAMGFREEMRVRLEAERPGERLVARRVDGARDGVTVFELAPSGTGTVVRASADLDVPFLVRALAAEPLRRGLVEQLANLDRQTGA
jgi:carbon monoxide dehydrogenase subunit G